MKPIAIHLDRLSQALSTKGIELKRTDLLQVAAAAFGYHNQNEASAASARGDLDPRTAVPICRVSIPSTPFEREIVVLKTEGELLYGVDAAHFDAVKDIRAERYGPTPYGTLVDLSYATKDMTENRSVEIGRAATTSAHFDCALREAKRLVEQLDNITGATDEQGQDIGQAENTLGRLIAALEGGAVDDRISLKGPDGGRRVTDAERASWGRDIDGMKEAIEILASEREDLAMVTPDTRRWADDCLIALEAGLRIASDWKGRYEQEVRFGPDWRAWNSDLKKASTRGATPLSDLDLHKIRHAVADNHSKSSESERSQSRWQVGSIMERHARSLLLRLDIAEAMLAGDLPPIRGNAHLRIGSLWRVDVGFATGEAGRAYQTVFYVVDKNDDGEVIGNRKAGEMADGRAVHLCKIRPAPREEAALRLLDAARQAIAILPEPSPARRALLSAIAAGDRVLPAVEGNPKPQKAPPQPVTPEGVVRPTNETQSWRHDVEQAGRLQDALVLCAKSHALDRRTAIATMSAQFGFDHARSIKVLDGIDLGVRNTDQSENG